jgi:hypothetical protein
MESSHPTSSIETGAAVGCVDFEGDPPSDDERPCVAPGTKREVTHLIGPEFHLANELAEERVRDGVRAEHNRQLLGLATQDRPARGSFVRRPAALLLAAVSRWTVAIVRWLDECVAEDLGRALDQAE